jgi:drug/metabolite transporter (DMT)-like permease
VSPWTPLVAATLGWACSAVLSKVAINRGVDAVTLVPIRLGFALVTLLAVIAVTGRYRTRSPRAWWRGAMLGTVAMGIPNVILTRALEDLPVSLGGLLLALIPLSTVASAHFVCPGERFRGASVPGLLVALVGMGFLVGIGGEDIDGVVNLWRGVAFSISGVALAGFGSALTRRYAQEVDKDELVLPQFVVGTAVLFLLIPPLFGMNLEAVDMTNLGIIAVIGTIGTTLPFTAFIVAAAINPAWRLGLTGYSVPVLAVFLAVVFLGEQFTLTMAIGAVLIVGGVVMADRANRGTPETIVPI